MHVLRAEKGFIIVGQETDGTVTPADLGLAGMIAKAKPDFVGKRSLTRPDVVASDRKQLVGLMTEDPSVVLEEGAQIVANTDQPIPMKMLGHVTSSYWSSNCGRSIAMALVAGGRAMMGQTLYVTSPNMSKDGGFVRVTVGEPTFFDVKGERVNA
jgi:sarcosine oxidase subunit alpha